MEPVTYASTSGLLDDTQRLVGTIKVTACKIGPLVTVTWGAAQSNGIPLRLRNATRLKVDGCLPIGFRPNETLYGTYASVRPCDVALFGYRLPGMNELVIEKDGTMSFHFTPGARVRRERLGPHGHDYGVYAGSYSFIVA